MRSTFSSPLFRQYVGYLASVLALALLVSAGVSLYFSYLNTRALVDEVQREKARSVAMRIEHFLKAVEERARAAVPLIEGDAVDESEQQLELLKLLRLAPAVTEAGWIDANGRERVRVSRVARDLINLDIDRSSEPAAEVVASGQTWYGSVYFLRDSAPHMLIAVPGLQRESGAVIADLNLTFVGKVVSTIQLGKSGYAYLVNQEGRLIAHPDLSLVLSNTNLSSLPQVRAALSQASDLTRSPAVIARDERGAQSITAFALVEPLGWRVLVEQPVREAFAPIYGQAQSALIVLVGGVLLAVFASFLLARRLVQPIRALEAGVRRISAGDLSYAVIVETRNELEDLARQFNAMAASLRESHAHLEDKIVERTRALAQAVNSKSLFFAAASHDLRQPVHALGLYIAQLEDGRSDADLSLVTKLAATHSALSDLLDALLDISQLDAGAIRPQVSTVALAPLFRRIEQAVAPAASAKELRLRVRPPRVYVRTDPILLERILLNLATNAVRYTRSGGVLLAARWRGDRVDIEVWDTGPGIPPDQQNRIFEEFYRLPSAERSTKGLGLGLAIVRRLARLLGIDIRVASRPGRGSKFSVSMPVASELDVRAITPSPVALATTFDAPLILLIDDDQAVRESAEGLLMRWGCRVISADSQAAATAAVTASREVPAAIVTDYRLGTHLGTDAVAEIRARCRKHIPGILITADPTSDRQAEADAADLYLLQKPLKPAKLRVVLQHILHDPTQLEPPAEVAGKPRAFATIDN